MSAAKKLKLETLLGLPMLHASSRAEWRAWLQENHRTKGVWLCSWKRHVIDKSSVSYEDAVLEALCFGWIDSTAKTIDEDRRAQRFTPRRPKSTWVRINKLRVEQLEAQGLMMQPGRDIIAKSKEIGWWDKYDPVEDLIEPQELADALNDVPAARKNWNAFCASAKKQMLWWVISAAKEETKTARIESIVENAKKNKKALP